jgi:hypothetical protein
MIKTRGLTRLSLLLAPLLGMAALALGVLVRAQQREGGARNPRVRAGSVNAGHVIAGLSPVQQRYFSAGSEANFVVVLFNALNEKEKQDLLNFLRSL